MSGGGGGSDWIWGGGIGLRGGDRRCLVCVHMPIEWNLGFIKTLHWEKGGGGWQIYVYVH